jgi:hypothetical protein
MVESLLPPASSASSANSSASSTSSSAMLEISSRGPNSAPVPAVPSCIPATTSRSVFSMFPALPTWSQNMKHRLGSEILRPKPKSLVSKSLSM